MATTTLEAQTRRRGASPEQGSAVVSEQISPPPKMRRKPIVAVASVAAGAGSADAAVVRHIGGRPFPAEETWAKMLRYAGLWPLLGFGYWAIEEKASGRYTGDVGFAQSRGYDIEGWAPGVGRWLEISSCSNYTDFQARRMNVRYRSAADAKPELVHTLNGSGVALARTVAALLETHLQPDGSIRLPEALHPHFGADAIS